MITVAILLARFTKKYFTPELFGATSGNLLHDGAMAWRQTLAEFLAVGRPVQTKDVRELDPSTWLRTSSWVSWLDTFINPP